MEGTRLGILTLLQRQPATVDQLSTELGLASATVRRHLDILQRDRLVAFQAVRRKQGRPEHAFSLTEEGHELMPKRYHLLLQRVLQSLDNADADDSANGASAARTLLAQIAHIMVEEYRSQFRERPEDEPTRLLGLVLEAEQFAPEIETREDGIRITLGNCPYRSVATENSAICALDHHLISEILGTPITNTSRINLADNLCTYDAPFHQASSNPSQATTL
ncbi:MAG: ArsR family transcriptional regulator [Chloroflexi bacterium]|nr:ArsR family transcriptional regulator [Chloroflexota bacterium]